MCTVSYLPTRNTHGFILTSNRDEAPGRHAVQIKHLPKFGKTITYPADPVSGGTWFAIASDGMIACLLNGAHQPFDPSDAHTHSRGQVVIDSFDFDDPVEMLCTYDFSHTAPFTLLVWRKTHLFELVWDGKTSFINTLNPGVRHFRSSATLYAADVRDWRKSLFDTWLANTGHDYDQDSIMTFHRTGGCNDTENGFVMNRDEIVRTLSITSVEVNTGELIFKHIDLLDENKLSIRVFKTDPLVAQA